MSYQPNPGEIQIGALDVLPVVEGREEIGERILWFKIDPYKVTICYADAEFHEKTEEFPRDKVKLSGFPLRHSRMDGLPQQEGISDARISISEKGIFLNGHEIPSCTQVNLKSSDGGGYMDATIQASIFHADIEWKASDTKWKSSDQ